MIRTITQIEAARVATSAQAREGVSSLKTARAGHAAPGPFSGGA
jgi:hypothetical protein